MNNPKTRKKVSETHKKLIKDGKMNPTKNLGDYCKKGEYIGKKSPSYGLIRSQETRRKIGIANSGPNPKISESLKKLYREGKIISHNKGKTKDNYEPLKKSSESQLGEKNHMYDVKGKNHPCFGIPCSEERKKKISEANSNPLLETRKKMSASKQDIPIEKWEKFISKEPYDDRWINSFKKGIRKRDNQVCMLCGVHREKLKKALYVHHINYNKKLTFPQNCISLCLGCHLKTNANRKHWKVFFQSLLSERYGYQYSENNEIILEIKNDN